MDYRKLNALTKKNRYPIPLIHEIMAQLSGKKWFTRLDIVAAFNNLRMHPDSVEYTTFKTLFGMYQYNVLPFGLTGGPSSWQRYMNDILFEFLGKFCSVYLDDILIYSDSLTEHKEHVRKVLAAIKAAGLQIDIDKSEFYVQETRFLGVIVGVDGIKMDPTKIEAIVQWATPRNLKEVQSFLGFCNFYRRFIQGFAKLADPLTKLTRKGVPFHWSEACQASFELFKKQVTSAPVLVHFDHTKQAVLETDSSDFVTGGTLSQIGNDGELHPVAFYSRKMLPAESNYEIYDKELLAIINCLETWRPELEFTGIPIQIFSDHRGLEYFMTKRTLTHRQARWAEKLSEYNFKITYRDGKSNQKADALTRQADSQELGHKHQEQVLLGSEHFNITLTDAENDLTIHDKLRLTTQEDEVAQKIMDAVNSGHPHVMTPQGKISLQEASVKDQLIFLGDCIWVPEPSIAEVIKEAHAQIAAGHLGRKKTYLKLHRYFIWKGMTADIAQYIANCHPCRWAKAPCDRTFDCFNPCQCQRNAGNMSPWTLSLVVHWQPGETTLYWE